MNNHPHNTNADERRDDFDHGDGTDRPAEMAGGAELDGLLRDWHETNRRAAAAGRDRLLEALRSGKAAQGPDQTETEAEATEQRENDSATRPGQSPMLPAMPARRHSPTLRRVQGSPQRWWGGQGGGMTRFGVLIAAMLAIAVIVPQLVPSRLTPTFDSTAYAGTTTLSPEGGRLDAIDAQGEPIGPFVLKRTEVDAQVTGRFVRVHVRQRYHNPYTRKIEAVYTFPLSDDGAVDRMTMTIGSRVIEGEVRERDEAREMYEAARESGRVASLLEQERANIFTQAVANIEPGAEIVIDISYVETLTERDGEFSFAFPTTVAPRYIPGLGPDGRPQVPDASRIAPAYAHSDGEAVARPNTQPHMDDGSRDLVPGLDDGVNNETPTDGAKAVIEDSAGAAMPSVRPGNDLSISVKIDTGGPGITGIDSPLHATSRTDWQSRADGNPRIVGIALTQAKEIANRDFVLKWRQTSDTVQESVFTHSGVQGNFLGVMLQPPTKVVESAVVPRELVFVLDTSGSMSGAPLDAAKRVMNRAIAGMRPVDRFNVVTFAGHTSVLWDSPRRATQENIGEAMRLVDSRQGGGGTEMMKAIDAALTQTLGRGDDREQLSRVRPLRIVMFLTDGEVGNDMAIIDAIQKNRGTTRVFSFGVGNSVNRYLLNGAARAGGGAAEFVLLPRDGQGPSENEINEVVDRFTRRTTTPILTNITVEPSPNLPLFDPQPELRNIPDVFDVTPVTILTRYADLAHPISGTLTIRGNTAAGPWQKVIPITLPATGTAPANDVLATLWARRQVESLLSQDLTGAQRGYVSPEIREAIVKIGEEFSIMSPYTSFVAVDKLRVTIDGEPQLINIPVHIPDQTNWENYFGLEESQLQSVAEYLRADKAADEDETRKVLSQMINSVNAYSAESPAKPSTTSSAAASQAPPVDVAASARGATASPPAPASPPASAASPAPVLAEIAPGGGSGGGNGAGDRVAPRSPTGDRGAEGKEAASKQDPARREQRKGERAMRESGFAAGAVGGSPMSPTTGTQSKGGGTSTFGRDVSSGNAQDKAYRHATMTIQSSPVVGDSAVGFDLSISQSGLEQHDLLLQRMSALRFSDTDNPEVLSAQHSLQALPRQMLAAAQVVRNSRLAQMSQADGLDDNTRANIQRSVQAVQTAPEEPLVQRWNAVANLPEQQAMLAQVAQVEREARAEFNLYAQAVNKVSPSLAAALDPEWLKTNRSNLAAQRTSPRQFSVPSFDNAGAQQHSDAAPQEMPRDEGVQQNFGDQPGASPSQANQIAAQSSLLQPSNAQSIFVVQDPLLVVVLVSDLTARHIQELRSAGLEILSTSREDKVAVGRLHLEDLKRMTELAFVLRIEPAEPVGVGTNAQSPRQQQQFQKRP